MITVLYLGAEEGDGRNIQWLNNGKKDTSWDMSLYYMARKTNKNKQEERVASLLAIKKEKLNWWTLTMNSNHPVISRVTIVNVSRLLCIDFFLII